MQNKLTQKDKDVLYYITEEFLTPKQIALRRKTSVQAIYKTIKKLKDNGVLDKYNKVVENTGITFKPLPKNGIRLHRIELNIKILYKDQRYKNILSKTNTLEIDGNTIRIYNDSIEAYVNKSFFAENVDKATVKSSNYISKLIRLLENDLKVILLKNRSQNIRIVNQHYAEINNGIAKECERTGDKIRVYGKEDGKLWFLIDNSFNLHEAETVHPKEAKQDMDKVKAVFNDIRDNKIHLPSEVKVVIDSILTVLNEVAVAQLNQTNIIKSLLPKKEEVNIIPDDSPDYFG